MAKLRLNWMHRLQTLIRFFKQLFAKKSSKKSVFEHRATFHGSRSIGFRTATMPASFTVMPPLPMLKLHRRQQSKVGLMSTSKMRLGGGVLLSGIGPAETQRFTNLYAVTVDKCFSDGT